MVHGEAVGRGRRGTGRLGDNEHAGWNAFERVKDRSQLPDSTLYTTLEPCTGEARSEPLKSCTEQIILHRIPRVAIGMLIRISLTGKGWRLQDTGVEVMLFPHELAQKIRAINEPFIRTQQSWGVKIISPTPDEELRVNRPGERYPVRFTAVNPSTRRNFLVTIKNGRCWPQTPEFRQIDKSTWEKDVHFGLSGIHELHLITANELGLILFNYHRQTLDGNVGRKKRIEEQYPQVKGVLGEIYPGIPINSGLPKGLKRRHGH